VHLLLGEKDNYTGTRACLEVSSALRDAGHPVDVITYAGALHGWDEDLAPIRVDDVSTEDCRWALKDDGSVWGGGPRVQAPQPLRSAVDGQAYFRACTKAARIEVGRVEPANSAGRQAVVEIARRMLCEPRPASAGAVPSGVSSCR
jgi:hypothetical protein